ncbi:hypothetical protein N7467_003062 [Penicillium canescens]|nr:hypothetical protein N7467_003062 [Penicillium canescens]
MELHEETLGDREHENTLNILHNAQPHQSDLLQESIHGLTFTVVDSTDNRNHANANKSRSNPNNNVGLTNPDPSQPNLRPQPPAPPLESRIGEDTNDEDDQNRLTQGHKLPLIGEFDISEFQNVVMLKSNGSNFLQWRREAERALRILRINQALALHLNRPHCDSADRNKCNYWSASINVWLSKIVKDEIISTIETNCPYRPP